MVKHIVMWTLKDEAGGKSKSENVQEVKHCLEALSDQISTIRFLEVGVNINDGPNAFDLVLYSEFDDREDLAVYQDHPAHIRARDFIRTVRDMMHVVDFEVDNSKHRDHRD